MWAVNPLDPSNTVFSSHPPTMGYVQTREHEAENCYVYFSKDSLHEIYWALKELSRRERRKATKEKLNHLADRFQEIEDLAHPRRQHFKMVPMNTSRRY
tara:strand:- start:158 stop:454 length:297 start_codon:yes stop_codon:yes gene_type:complete